MFNSHNKSYFWLNQYLIIKQLYCTLLLSLLFLSFLLLHLLSLLDLFTEDHIKWLLDEVLHSSIFGGAEDITKDHFMQIRGDSKEKHTFWRTVRQIAVEKFNMQEVFNMQSTVRLTAVENLGKNLRVS